MSNFEGQVLIDYIKDLIYIETDIAMQEKAVEAYGMASETRKPHFTPLPTPTRPAAPDRVSPVGPGPIICLIGTVFLWIVALCIYSVNAEYLNSTGIYGDIARENMSYVTVMLVISFLLMLPLIFSILSASRKNKEIDRYYEIAIQRYREDLAQIENKNTAAEKAYRSNLAQWSESNREISVEMSKPLIETKNLLAQMYELDVIYPKYRNLPALTSIYEYFVTGRCTELTGPHGAYNLYEDELRKDTVIGQLNAVIENLEQIRNNQYMLYQQVKAIQENTNMIASEVRQIRGYTVQIAQLTALNAYYAALNERNTRITMYYHL